VIEFERGRLADASSKLRRAPLYVNPPPPTLAV
jgi:hypothetical protein